MTGEGKGDTEKWIESKGAKFAYAYDKGGKVQKFFGVGGIPHAVLIDPSGQVVWSGHPSSLTDDIVAQNLNGALEAPVWEWPDSAKKVRSALSKRQYSKALDEAKGMGEEGAKIAGAIEALVKGKVNGLKSAADQGDWLKVEETAKGLEKDLAGLPEVEEAKAMLARLKDDKAAQAVLAAQKDIRKLMGGKIKKGDIPRIEKKLGEIVAEFPNSGASRDAERALTELKR